MDRSFKLKDYENRYISITYTPSSKEDLLAYIKNFDEKVLSIFRQNITKKLLGKQIILSINENFEDIKNIYNDEVVTNPIYLTLKNLMKKLTISN